MRTIWLSPSWSKYVSLKTITGVLVEVVKVSCIVLACVSVLYLLTGAVNQASNDCPSGLFVQNLCEMQQAELVEGPACSLICNRKATVNVCPKLSGTHAMNNHVMVQVCLEGCLQFAMTRIFFFKILTYSAGNQSDQDGEEIGDDTRKLHRKASHILDSYLNIDETGHHEVLLNTLPTTSSRPMAKSYISGFLSLAADKRFITHLLFAGNGEASEGIPYTDSESVPYVGIDTTCGGMYLTQSLENHTLSIANLVDTTNSNWFSRHYIHPFYVYQIVLKLLELEEVTTEHSTEGEFYRCHVNISQIFVDNWCRHSNPSLRYLLSHACTVKALDLSSMLMSKDQLRIEMSSMSCFKDNDCRYGTCQGHCFDSKCLPPRIAIDSLIDMCQTIKNLEPRLLIPIPKTEVNETGAGGLYTHIDRCMSLRVLVKDKTDSEAVLLYNTVFQGLKQHLVYKYEEIQYAIQHAAGV